MPIGIIVNVLSLALGGLAGSLIGNKLSEEIKQQMNMIFGICAMGMGIASIVLMKSMPAVVFAVIAGTIIGLFLKLGKGIEIFFKKTCLRMVKSDSQEMMSLFITAVVLFCASGTGIYGALDSGMTGNHSVLIAKSVLDFFTAIIFASQLGKVVSLISIPQFVIMIVLFLLAKVIFPMTNETMILDFKACGGFILLATGFRMMKLRELPIADMIPAMVLVMPISYVWTEILLPLIG